MNDTLVLPKEQKSTQQMHLNNNLNQIIERLDRIEAHQQEIKLIGDRMSDLTGIAVDSLDELYAENSETIQTNFKMLAGFYQSWNRTNKVETGPVKGIFSILLSMWDKDRRRGMVYILNFLKEFGKELSKNK